MIPNFSSEGAAVGKYFIRQSICLAVATLSAVIALSHRTAVAESSDAVISVSWKLLGNFPDSRFKSEIELRNDGKTALSNDWALYFNSASKLAPESGKPDFGLSHVNGDFYVLRPRSGMKPISP